MKLRIASAIICVFTCFCTSFAQSTTQNQDTLKVEKKGNIFQKLVSYLDEANKEKEEKRFDISFIGGPHYSGDTKLGLGMVASGLYRIDQDDKSISPSNVSLYGNVTTTGMYAIGIMGNTIFPKEKYRLDMDVYFASLPSRYWGQGYDFGKQKNNYTEYTRKTMQMKADFLVKAMPAFYLGATFDLKYEKGYKFDDRSYVNDDKYSYQVAGLGYIVTYDSRDFIPNPYKGMYFKWEQVFYPSFSGTASTFNTIDAVARYYKQIWKDGILAFDLNGIFNSSGVPWIMTARMGNSRQMRGYYGGQYNDKSLIQAQVELRQRIYHRSGAVVWAGAGNVFPSFNEFEWAHTLPNFGVGYRWEFKKRVNIRLDYGIGKGQSSFYFNVNESF